MPHRTYDPQCGLVQIIIDLAHLLEGETVWPLKGALVLGGALKRLRPRVIHWPS